MFNRRSFFTAVVGGAAAVAALAQTKGAEAATLIDNVLAQTEAPVATAATPASEPLEMRRRHRRVGHRHPARRRHRRVAHRHHRRVTRRATHS